MNAKGINVAAFRERHEIIGLARQRFYEDIDAGRMRHLRREFSLAPEHVQRLYMSLAAHEREYALKYGKPTPTIRQNRWYHKIVALFSREGRS